MNQNNQAAGNDDFLTKMGYGHLTGDKKDETLAKILFALNVRVGKRVADILTDEQLDDFEKLTASGSENEQELTDWLKQNVPYYTELIDEEARKMKQEKEEILDKVMGVQQ